MAEIKVFDFDNTIYKGESSIDFALFMMRSNKRVILYLPSIFWNLLRYKLCIVDREKLQAAITDAVKFIVRDKEEVLRLADSFWKKHVRKLDKRMLDSISADDVIVTASPSFLISAAGNRLKTKNIIGSVLDLDKKEVAYLNFGENKVKKYRELYGTESIGCFYTDSFNDKKMMDISDRVFLVKNGKLRRIK